MKIQRKIKLAAATVFPINKINEIINKSLELKMQLHIQRTYSIPQVANAVEVDHVMHY